jgi:hypothetical protein
MVYLRGRGQPRSLFNRVEHHARGVRPFLAPLAVAVYGTLARGDARHEMHVGAGWNSVNLYLANGRKIALRATGNPYREVTVSEGAIRGPGRRQVMVIASPDDVWRFERWLSRAAS